MKNCAFVNCGNSTYTIERWKQLKCSIHQDFHENGACTCPRPFTLIPFPTENESKLRWAKLINRKLSTSGKNWTPKYYSRVCSEHFVDGKPTAANPDPCLNLGYTVIDRHTLKRRPPPTQRQQPTKVAKVAEIKIVKNTDHDQYTFRCDCQAKCECPGCVSKQRQITALQHENAIMKEQLRKSPKPPVVFTKRMNINLFLRSNKCVKAYTGLPSKDAFGGLLNYLTPVAKKMTYWKGVSKVASKGRVFKKSPRKLGPGRKLTIKSELLLVLMKLRLGITNQLLADIFGISVCLCSQVFNTWIKMMSKELKPLVFWPHKQIISDSIPSNFQKQFPQLRCTLDCTEVFIDRPRHLELQAQTWSDYKKHNTVKLLIAIAPNGMISFVSRAWGGRASDKLITRESGFLNLVDPNDTILADRGFPIQEDLLLRHANLYIPPPSSGLEQQSKADVVKTKTIANARIHVERAIGRIKWFKILKNTLAISLVPLIDEIVIVCSALCNLLPPLVS